MYLGSCNLKMRRKALSLFAVFLLAGMELFQIVDDNVDVVRFVVKTKI